MHRIAAWPIITFMKRPLAIWNFSKHHDPRDPMGTLLSPSIETIVKRTIAVLVFPALPFPATIVSNLQSRPQSLFNWLVMNLLPVFSSATPRAENTPLIFWLKQLFAPDTNAAFHPSFHSFWRQRLWLVILFVRPIEQTCLRRILLA